MNTAIKTVTFFLPNVSVEAGMTDDGKVRYIHSTQGDAALPEVVIPTLKKVVKTWPRTFSRAMVCRKANPMGGTNLVSIFENEGKCYLQPMGSMSSIPLKNTWIQLMEGGRYGL